MQPEDNEIAETEVLFPRFTEKLLFSELINLLNDFLINRIIVWSIKNE